VLATASQLQLQQSLLVNISQSEVYCYIYTERSELGQDYPLNLSILLSGGKETNKDSHSNGE
jgi:hypothetical protein